MRPRKSAFRKSTRDGRKDLPSGPIRLGIDSGGEIGVPSVRTMWQPTPSSRWARAVAIASSKAVPPAISVAEVSTPDALSSPIARLTPGVRPKSSALRISRAGIACLIVEGCGGPDAAVLLLREIIYSTFFASSNAPTVAFCFFGFGEAFASAKYLSRL